MNIIDLVSNTRERQPPWHRPELFKDGPPRVEPKLGPVIPYALGGALLVIDGILIWRSYPYILQGSALALIVASCVVALLLIFYANVMQRYERDREFEDSWFLAVEDAGNAAHDREEIYFEMAKRIAAAQGDNREPNWHHRSTDDDDS